MLKNKTSTNPIRTICMKPLIKLQITLPSNLVFCQKASDHISTKKIAEIAALIHMSTSFNAFTVSIQTLVAIIYPPFF